MSAEGQQVHPLYCQNQSLGNHRTPSAALWEESMEANGALTSRRNDTTEDETGVDDDSGATTSSSAAVVGMVFLVRVAVGYQPHSGQDNYHGGSADSGSTATGGAYGGDFEAQRHWMELTVHLPMGEWYYHDPDYWGLDYPPLSAYQSWLCGKGSQWLVGPASVALYASRWGYEDPTHKAYMRATVLLFDALLYGTAVWYWTTQQPPRSPSYASLWRFARAMMEPSIILIDHGHFQYNTAALGFALWAFYCFTLPPSSSLLSSVPGRPGSATHHFVGPVVGSILFCCALSFKQMTLYYAPAVFAYLLGRCVSHGLSWRQSVRRFMALAVTVLSTLAATWWPFVLYGPDGTTPVQRLSHVLRRIFPLQRGLFEGKVANLWCALSVRPFRIRERLPAAVQPYAALVLTLVLMLPACGQLFRLGRRHGCPRHHHKVLHARHSEQFLWGVANSALSFFLASFQVHEKSLLLAVAPMSILTAWSSLGKRRRLGWFGDWFTLVATWTLWPLLVLDRLQVAYVCVLALFVALIEGVRPEVEAAWGMTTTNRGQDGSLVRSTGAEPDWWGRLFVAMTALVTLGLHVAEACITPPPSLPDLFPVLWSIVGCGLCLVAWMVSLWEVYRDDDEEDGTSAHPAATDSASVKAKRE